MGRSLLTRRVAERVLALLRAHQEVKGVTAEVPLVVKALAELVKVHPDRIARKSYALLGVKKATEIERSVSDGTYPGLRFILEKVAPERFPGARTLGLLSGD